MPERRGASGSSAAGILAGADVLHLSWSGQVGGIERQIELLLRSAGERSAYRHRALFLDGRGSAGDRMVHGGLAARLEMRSGLDLQGLWRLGRLLRATRPRVLHLHTTARAATLVALAAHRGSIVYTEHFPGVFDRSRRHRRLYASLRSRQVAGVAPAPAVARAMAACGFAGAVEVVPNACGVPIRAVSRPPGSLRTIGFVTRLVAPARVDLLLQVVVELDRLGLPCALLVVGDGPQRAPLLAAAERALGRERAQFVGEQADVAPWLDRMDCCLLTRETAIFSAALVEAMARGVPVMALACRGGAAELVAEAGRLLPDRRVDRAATAVAELLSSPSARRELQERGWRLAGRCEPATVLSRLEALYEAAVTGDRARTPE